MPGDQGSFQGKGTGSPTCWPHPACRRHLPLQQGQGAEGADKAGALEGVAEVFSRTANGCGHRQIAMCLRAEKEASVANKTVLKIMHEMGISCG